MWESYYYKKKKENLFNLMNLFLNKKIISNYQNKFIRNYNIINSCENFYNFNNNDKVIEISDLNYENILKNEYNIIDKTMNSIDNYSIKNNVILSSASNNVLNNLFENLYNKSKNFLFINQYIYNNNKK